MLETLANSRSQLHIQLQNLTKALLPHFVRPERQRLREDKKEKKEQATYLPQLRGGLDVPLQIIKRRVIVSQEGAAWPAATTGGASFGKLILCFRNVGKLATRMVVVVRLLATRPLTLGASLWRFVAQHS